MAGEDYIVEEGEWVDWFHENVECQYACPAHTDVPLYLNLIAEGRYDEAYLSNRDHNVFPGVLGRVCSRPCEAACRRKDIDETIRICWSKRATYDFKNDIHWESPPDPALSGYRKVAIIGAGPAGLAAARELARKGYIVTIYDALPKPGGMLWAAIPEFRLPRDVLEIEIEYIQRLGVKIILNTKIGDDIPLEQLMAENDAVLIAAGTQSPMRLNMPGEDLGGVVPGLTFMEQVCLYGRQQVGKRVAVIGGGYTAMDCSRSAIRLGAEKVWVLYRRTQAEILVDEEERGSAELEGAEFLYLVSPVEILSKDGKMVSGIKLIRNQLGEPDRSGRRRPVPISGSEFVLECDMVIPAVSQSPDDSLIPETMPVEKTRDGFVKVDPKTYTTSAPGLFATADFVVGPKTIIFAISEGRKAAASIDRYIRGPKELDFGQIVRVDDRRVMGWTEEHEEVEKEFDIPHRLMHLRLYSREESYIDIPQQPMPHVPMPERVVSPNSQQLEVELGYDKDLAQLEARRCLQCNLNIFIDGELCILCDGCVDICPYYCIEMVPLDRVGGDLSIPELAEAKSWPAGAAMMIDETQCIRCAACVDRCPTGAITMDYAMFDNVLEREVIPLKPVAVGGGQHK